MIGVEFVLDRESKEPARQLRDRFVQACFESGLLVLGAGPSTVRLSPPLILSDEEVDVGLALMEQALVRVAGE
jgi:4-aminobutyrate aminotransferase